MAGKGLEKTSRVFNIKRKTKAFVEISFAESFLTYMYFMADRQFWT